MSNRDVRRCTVRHVMFGGAGGRGLFVEFG